jgi:hypothetical protein
MTDLLTTIKEAEQLVREKHAGHSDQSVHTPKRYLGGGGAGGEEAAAAGKSERRALAAAFVGMGDELKPDEVKSIDYRRRKTNILMEDVGGKLGHMRVTLDQDMARQYGTSLDQVETYLKDNGAKKMKPKKRRKPSYSYYD